MRGQGASLSTVQRVLRVPSTFVFLMLCFAWCACATLLDGVTTLYRIRGCLFRALKREADAIAQFNIVVSHEAKLSKSKRATADGLVCFACFFTVLNASGVSASVLGSNDTLLTLMSRHF